jgi:hypothetical protein
MITQKIRIVVNTSKTILFDFGTIFSGLKLNSLVTPPAWITENLVSGTIGSIDVTPPGIREYYFYYTLGGSPSNEDALLIIEGVESLSEDITNCIDQRSYVIDSVSSFGGDAQINADLDFDNLPKLNDYIFINGSNYSGYHRVKNALTSSQIVIDTPYIGAISPALTMLYTFEKDTTKCIVWINRQGGRCCYTFDQRVNYEGLIGDAKVFDTGVFNKYNNRGKNYDYVSIYKTGISNEEVDLIESLRYSIQAWEFDIKTATARPILIDSNSYGKYNTKINLNDIVLKYKIATYKLIQTQ